MDEPENRSIDEALGGGGSRGGRAAGSGRPAAVAASTADCTAALSAAGGVGVSAVGNRCAMTTWKAAPMDAMANESPNGDGGSEIRASCAAQ